MTVFKEKKIWIWYENIWFSVITMKTVKLEDDIKTIYWSVFEVVIKQIALLLSYWINY